MCPLYMRLKYYYRYVGVAERVVNLRKKYKIISIWMKRVENIIE